MANNDLTIQAYDKYHEIYDLETIDFWDNFPKTTIDAFVTNLKWKKVLNLGSGSGRDAVLLRKRGIEVVCLDASGEMVKRTRNLGFKSIKQDFTKLSFNEGEFGGVWAYTSLIHIKKDKAREVIKRIRRILKPGGLFLMGAIEGGFEGFVERGSMPGVKLFFKYYTRGELNKMVLPLGYKLIYEEKYKPGSKTFRSHIYMVEKER